MSEASAILLIDDSEIILERVKLRLEAEGYRVITTTQTVGVARYLLESKLVIIDWHMPGMSGGEVLASLRAALSASAARPLFYLYTSDHHTLATARNLGFDGHFINKGNDDSLVRQIEAAFRLNKFRPLSVQPDGSAKRLAPDPKLTSRPLEMIPIKPPKQR